MQMQLNTVEDRRKFVKYSIILVLIPYFAFIFFASLLVDPATFGFGLVAIGVSAPLQAVLLCLYAFFFERGYYTSFFLLLWVVLDLLSVSGFIFSPSYLLLEMVL